MNIADSFYIALCMTVLLLGVVYWFWTQTQYLQRKINLLENIVYELKTLMDHGGKRGHEGGPVVSEPHHAPVYAPAPGSELGEDEDLLHEELHGLTETEKPAETVAETIAETTAAATVTATSAVVNDDLQPGGVGSGLPDSALPESKPRGNVLDGMTLKELRRLAEQRNIPGASGMRKQALIDSLRSDVKPAETRSSESTETTSGSPIASIRVGEIAPFEDNVVELA